MGGVRPRLKPGSSEGKYRALPLHQPCLVDITLSGRHNALIIVVKSGVNSGNRGNIFLDHGVFKVTVLLGCIYSVPSHRYYFPTFHYFTTSSRVYDTPLLPKVRVKWSAALPCIREALSSNLGAETMF